MTLKLTIGNKNYSSWSFRPWIAMKVAGIAFEEEVISLNAADFKARVGKISGTGKVPALTDGEVHVWESLAILEYLAEKFPAAGLWPAEPAGAGACPRDRGRDACRLRAAAAPSADEHVAAGQGARPHAGGRRPMSGASTRCGQIVATVMVKAARFLFGPFGAADAMYAPVVSRFHTYAVEVSATSRELYGRRDGVAGLGRMARRGAAGALGAARG